jgi:hypothetical protein
LPAAEGDPGLAASRCLTPAAAFDQKIRINTPRILRVFVLTVPGGYALAVCLIA